MARVKVRYPRKDESNETAPEIIPAAMIQSDDVLVSEERECQAKSQELELKIRRVEGLSTVLIEEQPGWVEMAKRYVAWYEGVETVIRTMLGSLGIRVAGNRDQNGCHKFHENLLEELGRPENPFYEVLGRDDVLFQFRQAKDVRNLLSGLGKGAVYNGNPPDWNAFTTRNRGIERNLWSSLAFFKLEFSRRKGYDRHLGEKEQQLRDWETSLHVEQQTLGDRESKIQEDEEKLKCQMKEVEDKKQEKELEEQKQLDEIAQKKLLDAAILKERKNQEDAIKKAKADLAEQEKKTQEAAKLLKTKTQLQKDIQKLRTELQEARNNDKGPEVEGLTNKVVELEAKVKRQADEIKRLEEKANGAMSYCAKQLITEKESYRQSLKKMRKADAKTAEANLEKERQHLQETHQHELQLKIQAHKDEVKAIHDTELDRLKTSLKVHQDELAAQYKIHSDNMGALQAAHVEELRAKYRSLEKELERVNRIHKLELARSEASDKPTGLIKSLFYKPRGNS